MHSDVSQPSISLHAATAVPNPAHIYQRAREAELKGLQDRGTFIIVHRSAVPRGTRIYRTRFVDKKKEDGTLKSRLCVQAYKDNQHGLFIAAPTMQRSSMTLFFAICAMMHFDVHLRGI
jgi:hypothetical protein